MGDSCRACNLYTDVATAAAILRRGGVVAIPTETVYGLAGNALSPSAVARIFEVKERPHFDPLIVHIATIDQLAEVAEQIPAEAYTLGERFWPGPLTLVLRKRAHIPDLVTSGLPTVAVRMPRHPMALAVIHEAGVPLAAPSANRFGRISPTTAEHVFDELGDRIDAIVDGGPCEVGVESTILSLAGDKPVLLRAGGCPIEEIERVIGQVTIPEHPDSAVQAPGMLASHYAPRTPMVYGTSYPHLAHGTRVGLLCLRRPPEAERFAAIEELSPVGDEREAATNLFAAMRRLDALGLDLIVALPVPDTGLGRAINDRLRRASAARPAP